ncbi:lysophospholipid acyltransferase family protein [Gordonia sp. ABSL1-1]|uniref:lysophospholipid acyltransferase family protein n=1 Tax=Gordonia sp. ABSL1-1 TaxID=3053923 RepID=UPI002572BA04|nr:lysophospholipid acyltransferase family protein [Gordonia sp. ABSL1-1]MDL9935686.1 lysophospholipid acyltransferase family protein [Gordonia sp. ABSL1-1]
MWYWLFKYVLVGPLLWLRYRPRVVGADRIPSAGPVIVAANHRAFVDSLLICFAISRPVYFVAKQEYFAGVGWPARLRRWFFTAAGQIPIDRRGGDHAGAALATATAILDAGGVWAIHPEGTRTPGDRIYRGRTGVMRVAQTTGAAVYPVGIRGTGGRWARASVVIGAPLGPEVTADLDARAATDRLMADIAVLAAVGVVGEYAQRDRR